MRVAIWTVAVMLILYSGSAVVRIEDMRTARPTDEASLRADSFAASLDSEAHTLRAALLAAADMAGRTPQSPMEAAETGLAAAAGSSASAVAIATNEGLRAQTRGADGDWSAALSQAQRSENPFWLGAPRGPGHGVYAAMRSERSGTSFIAIARIDPSRYLPAAGPNGVSAIIAPNGGIIAASGAGAANTKTLQDALNVRPSDKPAAMTGRLGGRHPVQVIQRPAADGAWIAVMAGPANATSDRGNLFFLLAPMIIGVALALLLMIQSRNATNAQMAQLEAEQRFRMAVEAARCGIWEWDLREDRVVMSDVTGVMLGWGGGGVASASEVLERIAPDHRERVQKALASARSYGAFDVSFKVPKEGGRPIWIDARGQATPGRGRGDYARIVGVALDVTDERYAQARAQAAETRLRDAIDSVSEAFVLWDRNHRLLMCNKNYREFFNLEPNVLRPGANRTTVEACANLAIQQEMAPADGRRGVREAELADGRWVQISERRTSDGGLVITAADITAIKTQDEARRLNEEALQRVVTHLEQSQEQLAELARKYEAEKIKAESANKSKSDFLANMSHELRTPLNAINGFSEIMVGEMFGPLGDARYKEYSRDILNSGQHLLALINDILDMSKIEAGKMTLKFEPLQFMEVAEDAVRLIRNRADSAGLKIEVDIPEMDDIDADYRAIKQVLLNLLSNALKFTPRGGVITLKARLEAERLKVSVIDTGIGISPDDLQRLAKPFEQIESQHSKTQQGTGLGLALTKSLVEMHGGLLELASEPSVGTTVTFILPVKQAPVKQAGSFAA